MIKITTAPFIPRSHGISRFIDGEQLNPLAFEDMRPACMIKVGVGEQAIFDLTGIEIPIADVADYLIHGIAAPTVKHDQSVAGIEDIGISIIPQRPLQVVSHSIKITSYLVQVFQYLHDAFF
jgi:hypothetical protein